jgi:hypothetical protein
MAASKSASRRSAAKKAAKTRKARAAGKKAAATRKKRAAAKKSSATRKTKAAAASQAKLAANTNTPMRPRPSDVSPAVAELDERIAIIRNNLRELVEQAASYSGAANEELISQRISEQETKLEALRKQRDGLSQRGS